VILGAIPLRAQESKAAQGPEPKIVQGQLMRVDGDARTLAIQSSTGSPMVFRYTDDTKVIGADKNVAGLATMSGSPVTVQYIEQDKDNVATQIEIHQKK
jgi:hypothetical protein